MRFRFGCRKHCKHKDGQRRAKPAGESQFNQKAWGCLDLIRVYTVSSQIIGGKSFTSEKKFNNKTVYNQLLLFWPIYLLKQG